MYRRPTIKNKTSLYSLCIYVRVCVFNGYKEKNSFESYVKHEYSFRANLRSIYRNYAPGVSGLFSIFPHYPLIIRRVFRPFYLARERGFPLRSARACHPFRSQTMFFEYDGLWLSNTNKITTRSSINISVRLAAH